MELKEIADIVDEYFKNIGKDFIFKTTLVAKGSQDKSHKPVAIAFKDVITEDDGERSYQVLTKEYVLHLCEQHKDALLKSLINTDKYGFENNEIFFRNSPVGDLYGIGDRKVYITLFSKSGVSDDTATNLKLTSYIA